VYGADSGSLLKIVRLPADSLMASAMEQATFTSVNRTAFAALRRRQTAIGGTKRVIRTVGAIDELQ
jgi:hypothetical protein